MLQTSVEDHKRERTNGGETMLWVAFVILFSAWLVAMITSFTLGGFIHLLLVIALTLVLVRFIDTRRIV